MYTDLSEWNYKEFSMDNKIIEEKIYLNLLFKNFIKNKSKRFLFLSGENKSGKTTVAKYKYVFIYKLNLFHNYLFFLK
jgi:hypothetical protein